MHKMSKNGFHLIKPTSISYSGTSASISTNGSVPFSSVSSVSLNGVFSADYDNYMIVAITAGTSATTLRSRMRSSGTDATSTDYENSVPDFYNSTYNFATYTSGDHLSHGPVGASGYTAGNTIWYYGPYLSNTTIARVFSTGPWSSAYPGYIIDTCSKHNPSTSYDGLTLYVGAGTMSGRFVVYGMRK